MQREERWVNSQGAFASEHSSSPLTASQAQALAALWSCTIVPSFAAVLTCVASTGHGVQ